MTPDTVHTGWDYFVRWPGQEGRTTCRICGESLAVEELLMDCHPHEFRRAGIALALMHVYSCPFHECDWRLQALLILRVAQTTPSKVFEERLHSEAAEILSSRKATKDVRSEPDESDPGR